MSESKKPSIFICYAHADNDSTDREKRWLDRLLKHLESLVQQDDFVTFSDKDIEVGENWHAKIQGQLREAKAAVIMASPTMLASKYVRNQELPILLKRRKDEGLRIFPMIVRPCAIKETKFKFPDPKTGPNEFTLTDLQAFNSPDKPLNGMDESEADATLLAVARKLQEIAKLLDDSADKPDPPGREPGQSDGPLAVETHRLPNTGEQKHLIGRSRQLGRLTRAWNNPKTHVLSLVAFGGVGKSALVNRWLAGEKYRGARRVFGWSAYSQGSKERTTTAEVFLNEALKFFGFKGPLPTSVDERAVKLAELVAAERNLLVLDGIEPLQYPPGDNGGGIKDGGLRTLLKSLSAQNRGLAVVTTRVQVKDLAQAESTTCPRIDLDTLEPADGAELLAKLGVDGSDAEREEASREFGGHALALTLLGTLLRDHAAGDIRRRADVGRLEHAFDQGGHARRVMDSYETWLGDGPERQVLRLIGLFDRPADAGAVRALRREPVLDGLTDRLADDAAWRDALAKLRRAELLLAAEPTAPDMLDAHPLVREHFGEKLRDQDPTAWRAGHDRLFEYCRGEGCSEHLPDTLEAMGPLFAAVTHGCAAGRHQASLDEVYCTRILRGDEAYSTRKLGAFPSDLAALSGFFERPWNTPVASLSDADRAFVLHEAGFDLRALGRLAEAIEPIEAGLKARIAQENWESAAISAGNVSELQLALGRIDEATAKAGQAVEYADRSEDPFQPMLKRITLADALHHAGRLDEALALFEEAEALQKAREPEYPRLYSLQGYQYCDLLLTLGRHEEVLDRATETLGWTEKYGGPLDIGLDHVSLARALVRAAESGRDGALDDARRHANRAVDSLHQAGHQEILIHGLLARAEVHLHAADRPAAQRDLDEARELALRDPAAPMKLHEAAIDKLQERLEQL